MKKDAAALSQRLDKFPRLGVAQLPTPLQPLSNLTAHLGGPEIFVKREDLTGLGLGGNKLRKIDYVLKEALDQGADCIVSGGVGQSNSARQVAAACAQMGVPCHLAVFKGRLQPSSERYYSSGNALLSELFGAIRYPRDWAENPNETLEEIAQTLRSEGHKPAILPYGISNTLGTIGYSSIALEIAQQMAQPPAAIIFASGSGGTHAGLAIGADIALPNTKVIGFDIDADPERVRQNVVKLVLSAAEQMDWRFDPAKIDLRAGMAGPAYGVPHQKCLDALKLAGRLEGLILDPTYSAKAMAGLISLVEDSALGPNDQIVFVHTGGDAAVFAYEREQLGFA